MAEVLYRKWRPRRWDQVVGQGHVVQTLRNAVAAGRVAHAYLFAGPRGTGKTTAARLLAKAVNCLDEDPNVRPCDRCAHCQAVGQGRFLDLIEIDAASNTSVDDVRDLRDKIHFAPNQGRYKVYIVDEVHMLSTAAFNALLKTLEEPPPHAIFVLATTEVHKVPATVLSRCQRHEFRRLPVAEIVAQLETVAAGERLDVHPEALTLVARQATGSLRDAISLLDQLSATGEPITLKLAQEVLGTAMDQSVLEVVDALGAGDPARGLDQIQGVLDAGGDPRQFARQIVGYMRDVLLARLDNLDQVEATAEMRKRLVEHAAAFEVGELVEIIQAFSQAAAEARGIWQPSLPLELAFLESIQALRERPARSGRDLPEIAEPDASAGAPPEPSADPPAEGTPERGPTSPGPASAGLAIPADDQLGSAIGQNWRRVLAAVRRRNPQTQALLNSCRPMGVRGGALILGFASDLLRSKMEKPENVGHVRAAFAEVLGMDLEIRCVVSGAAQGNRADELGGLEEEGMVAIALRDLGGEIVDIQ